MSSNFAAIDYRTGPQLYLYTSAGATAQGSTFSTVETVSLTERHQVPRVVQFGAAKELFAFVGDGVYRTQDGGVNWQQVYIPTGLTATSSTRFGPIVVYVDGTPYLCIGYNGFRIARSSDGVNWEESNPITFGRGSHVTNLAVYNNYVYASDTGIDAQTGLRWFDFKAMNGGSMPNIFNSGPESGAFVIHNDTPYFIHYRDGTTPRRLQLFALETPNNPRLIASFDTATTLDGSSANAAWSSNNRIYYLGRDSASGLNLYRSDTGLTTFEEITSSGVPSTLQTNTQATVNKVLISPTKLDGSDIKIYSRNAGDVWDIYTWDAATERLYLTSTSVGSTLHSLPFVHNVSGAHFYNPGLSRVDIIETKDTAEGVKLYFKLYGENGLTQSANVAITYGSTGDIAVNNAATLVSPSAGSISGNQIINLSADNGATIYDVTWDLRSDGFDPEARYRLIGSMSINRPARRRRRRRRWYKL